VRLRNPRALRRSASSRPLMASVGPLEAWWSKKASTSARRRHRVRPSWAISSNPVGTPRRIEPISVSDLRRPRGHALIDRALYLPRSWAEDDDRCDAAGIPQQNRGFATKPTLAAALIERAVAAEMPASWVAGDEVYGADPRLRAAVRGHGLGYVLSVAANRRVPTGAGPIRVDALPALLPPWAWQRHSAGSRSPRAAAVLVGVVPAAGRRRLRHWCSPFADPPQRFHRRACLPALLQPTFGAAACPGRRGRPAVAHRGILPGRQRPGWVRSAPGPALAIPVSMDHSGYARSRLPGRGHRG
jgi:hypothetical protein